jgi:hypothetical protein
MSIATTASLPTPALANALMNTPSPTLGSSHVARFGVASAATIASANGSGVKTLQASGTKLKRLGLFPISRGNNYPTACDFSMLKAEALFRP